MGTYRHRTESTTDQRQHNARSAVALRDETMAALYRDGHTLQVIGQRFGCSRERVRQIIGQQGVEATDGGQALVARRKRAAQLAARQTACMERYGCTLAQYRSIPPKARCAFTQNRKYVRHVIGMTWHLTLWQWWTFWQESGKWNQRSPAGYILHCIDRAQGYRLGNVEIVPMAVARTGRPRKAKRNIQR